MLLNIFVKYPLMNRKFKRDDSFEINLLQGTINQFNTPLLNKIINVVCLIYLTMTLYLNNVIFPNVTVFLAFKSHHYLFTLRLKWT